MESLILAARQPIAGQVLPHIAAGHNDEVAAQLYSACLEDTARLLGAFCTSSQPSDANRKVVLVVDGDERDPVIVAAAQLAGARIAPRPRCLTWPVVLESLQCEFDRGARAAAVMFCDAPTVPLHIVEHAFRALLFHDVVLGPCVDGGAYLVGMQRPMSAALEGADVQLDHCVEQLAVIAEHASNLQLLPFWYRITRPENVATARSHLGYLQAREPERLQATARALEQLATL